MSTQTPALTYDDYDTVARACVDTHRTEMIDALEQVPNQQMVAALLDLVEHEATADVHLYPSLDEHSILQLYVTPAKLAEIDVLAHGAGFEDRSREKIDLATVFVTYTLAPVVWETPPEPVDPSEALDEAFAGFKRASFGGEGEGE